MNPLSRLKLSSKKILPVIFQTERTECGLACLVMVAFWFGYKADLNTLRKAYPASSRGTSLWDLINLCKKMKLNARTLRLEPKTLSQLRGPAILHWNMDHFVVLKKATKKHVIIHDPAIGEVKYTIAQIGKYFTGLALEIIPANDFIQCNKQKKLTLSNVCGSLHGWGKQLITLLCFAFTIELCAILIPLFTQLILDKVLPARNSSLLYLLGAAFLVTECIKVTAEVLRNWVIIYVMNSINMQITSNLIQHLIALPLTFFENRSTGDILSRFYSIDDIQKKITTDFVQVITDSVMTFITLIMMIIYSVKLTVISLLFMGMTVLFRMVTYRKLRRCTEEQIICESKEKSQFIETLKVVLPLKIFNKQCLRTAQWQTAHADTLNTLIVKDKTRLFFSAGCQLLSVTENIALIFMSATLVLHQQLSAGMMIAFLAFSRQFSGKAHNVIDKLTDYKMVSLYLLRLSDIVLQSKETNNTSSLPAITKKNIKGALAVKKLSFRYDEKDPFLFENLSFEVDAGQSVAIVAPSGFGKTTLFKVLMQLIPFQTGEMILDGRSLSIYSTEQFRSFCAAVMQDDHLLSGSLLDNICFFDERPDIKKTEQAAKLACIHDDIVKMGMGYHTLVGESGSHLSGGQRQRILIARALYRQPKILFMDEATSHLDEPTEKKITDNIKQLSITTIIISHRQTTINSADKVINLQSVNAQTIG